MSRATVVRNPSAVFHIDPTKDYATFTPGHAYEDHTGAIYLCVAAGHAAAFTKHHVLLLQVQDTKEGNDDWDFYLFTLVGLGSSMRYREVHMAINVGG